MITVFINNIAYTCQKNLNFTILQLCETFLIQQIPVFCYHEKLSIAANCRMCLVEVEKMPKPIASCSMPISDGMKIFTETPLVRKARESVLEFLLLNHPLDCPICDQGGECDLQDQSMLFGSDTSRFFLYKRGIIDKNCGPLIKTIMTRCIHCTRCVRFASEILNIDNFGVTGRGTLSEIGFYIETIIESELSGNLIDLCPVGALTSKPYAFKTRSWELKITNTVDISDGLGSNILVYSQNSEIIRILPKLNININENWISDKTRFSFDGLQLQRIDVPLIRLNNQLIEINWSDVLIFIKNKIQEIDSSSIGCFIGDLTDVESAFLFKEFFFSIGSLNIKLASITNKNLDFRFNYAFNSQLSGILNNDVCLLVGVNPKKEASLLNLRLNQHVKNGQLVVAYIGSTIITSFSIKHLGLSLLTFFQIINGQHPFCNSLKMAQRPLIIYGLDFIKNVNSTFIDSVFKLLKKNLINSQFNFLSQTSSFVGCADIGLLSNPYTPLLKLAYLCNIDELATIKLSKNVFLIYQGSFWTESAKNADVILPIKSFVESDLLFVNIEGRLQKTNKVLTAKPKVRLSWQILRVLGGLCLHDTYKKNIFSVFSKKVINNIELFKLISNQSPNIKILNNVEISIFNLNIYNKLFVFLVSSNYIKTTLLNFYKTNTYSKLSFIMSKCSMSLKKLTVF